MKTRKNARHNHAGIGVCSPNPAHTPAIFLSVADFFKFRTLSQKELCRSSIIHLNYSYKEFGLLPKSRRPTNIFCSLTNKTHQSQTAFAGGAGPSDAGQPASTSGGWNRMQIEVADLEATVEKLKSTGGRFRNQIVTGNGGKQILIDDPSGTRLNCFSPSEHDQVGGEFVLPVTRSRVGSLLFRHPALIQLRTLSTRLLRNATKKVCIDGCPDTTSLRINPCLLVAVTGHHCEMV
jgi:predicted enzyme related to lactoylglutathione lyase